LELLWSLELVVWSLFGSSLRLVKAVTTAYLTLMKQLIAVAVLCAFCGLNCLAADSKADASAKGSEPVKIKADEAKTHVGEQAVVSGTVAEVNRSASLVRLNFGEPYPKNVFTAVIFNRNTNDFPEVDKLKGKTVEITGKVQDYHGHPEIIVNSTNQVKVGGGVTEKGEKAEKAEKKSE
jgi:DNA/RNA endonuclease YhcR with UshA esterase domain